jgi:hypothetical protein
MRKYAEKCVAQPAGVDMNEASTTKRKDKQMSKVIAGHVVSRNAVTGMWRAWPTSKDTGSVYADTYRGILAMIRASNASTGA